MIRGVGWDGWTNFIAKNISLPQRINCSTRTCPERSTLRSCCLALGPRSMRPLTKLPWRPQRLLLPRILSAPTRQTRRWTGSWWRRQGGRARATRRRRSPNRWKRSWWRGAPAVQLTGLIVSSPAWKHYGSSCRSAFSFGTFLRLWNPLRIMRSESGYFWIVRISFPDPDPT